jgi:hypothetical protein
MGFGLVIRFIEHLYLIIEVLSLIYTLYKSLQHALSQYVIIFVSRCSVMVPNNGDSFALMLTALPAAYDLTSNS